MIPFSGIQAEIQEEEGAGHARAVQYASAVRMKPCPRPQSPPATGIHYCIRTPNCTCTRMHAARAQAQLCLRPHLCLDLCCPHTSTLTVSYPPTAAHPCLRRQGCRRRACCSNASDACVAGAPATAQMCAYSDAGQLEPLHDMRLPTRTLARHNQRRVTLSSGP